MYFLSINDDYDDDGGIQCVGYLVHDDGAVDGQLEVGECRLDDRQYFTHPVDLLA